MPAFSLFAILGVVALRLRLRNRCGLGLNRNPPFLDGHYSDQEDFKRQRRRISYEQPDVPELKDIDQPAVGDLELGDDRQG